jgi:WD40 repeat protein
MTLKPRDPKYYVVGGPVQPDRDCYQQRVADPELYRRLSECEYCYVLAQRQTGKTSLAASVARKLRAAGVLVAVVDLTQASGEDPSENAGRWYYSIAYRIVRELRIRVDVQTWWKERSGLTNLQRFREFFLEIVLEETSEPAVIILDRVEATQGEPRAQDLFAAIRACYDARVTDTMFQRLSFALFGSAAPEELVKNVQGSPFEIAVEIPLPDFSAQEMAGLMAGLGEPMSGAQELLSRVWTWTRGHPYLSQKIFRGLARRRADELTADSVDELVQTQFLSPNALHEEPHLSAIAARLTLPGPGRTARLNLYGRIRKGVEVTFDNTSTAQQELLTAGVVTIATDGTLRARNEIYTQVFGMRWVNQNLPYGFKSFGIAAAIIALAIALPIWYTEYLPRPYVNALSSANQDYEVAEDAYESLAMLPGYSTTANRLFEDFLARMSRTAETLPAMMRIHSRLIVMPGGVVRADTLLAEFWDRQSAGSRHQGERDASLITLLEALQQPTGIRRRLAAELIGQDYRNLAGSIHTKARLVAVETDEPSGLLTVLDERNNVDIWSVDGARPRLVRNDVLIAEEQLQLEERRQVPEPPTVPRLLIRTTHQRPEQVVMLVRAPSGQQARLSLAAGTSLSDNLIAFDFAAFPQLQNLLTAEVAGNWSIALSDLEQGVGGELLDWGLVAAGVSDIATENYVPQPIPEPRSSENAVSRLGRGGRLALSWPADALTQGPVLVWDLASDEVLTRVARSNEFINAQLALGGERVITLEQRQISIWDTASGDSVGVIELNTQADPELHISANGRYLAVHTSLQDGSSGVAVWDIESARRIGQPITAETVGAVAIDSLGKNLAIGGRDPWVRVWSLADGALLRELEHSSPPRRLLFDATGEWLATSDLSNTFRLWSITEGGQPLVERLGSSSWMVDFADDSSHLLLGSSDRAYEIFTLPAGRGIGVRLHHALADSTSLTADRAPAPVMLASRNVVITTDGWRNLKVWSVPGVQTPVVARARKLGGGSIAALSGDGNRIAVGTPAGDVRIFAVGAPGGILLGSGDAPADSNASAEIVNLTFSSDRSVIASASMDGRVRVWNAADGSQRDLLIVHPDGAAHDMKFIEQDRYLVSASRREAIVTDLLDGSVAGRLRIQANHTQLAVAAETGDVFIADDLDGVTLWNWRTGQSERIVDSAYQIRKVAVSADGTRLVTASDERTLTLWDVTNRVPLEQTSQAPGKVDDMWLVGDGGSLLVQAGPWLQSLSLFPAGLSPWQTRLLASAPASVAPDASGRTAFVLSSSPSRPTVKRLTIGLPNTPPVEGQPEELRVFWRERLGLSLDADGKVQPQAGYATTVSAAPVSTTPTSEFK